MQEKIRSEVGTQQPQHAPFSIGMRPLLVELFNIRVPIVVNPNEFYISYQ